MSRFRLLDCNYSLDFGEMEEIIIRRKDENRAISNEDLYSGVLSFNEKKGIVVRRIDRTYNLVIDKEYLVEREKVLLILLNEFMYCNTILVHSASNVYTTLPHDEFTSLIEYLLERHYDEDTETYSMGFIDEICKTLHNDHRQGKSRHLNIDICIMTILIDLKNSYY
jgi:hypothetical protein